MSQPFQDSNDLLRLGSDRVIRIHFRVSDDPGPVNNESARHGKCPGIIPVVFTQINAELKINLFEILGKSMNQAISFGHTVSRIAEKVEGQIFFLDQLTIKFRLLWRNCQKIGTC